MPATCTRRISTPSRHCEFIAFNQSCHVRRRRRSHSHIGRRFAYYCSLLQSSIDGGRSDGSSLGSRRPSGEISRLEIMMIASGSIPILTFIFAAIVTKTYSERYASGVTVFAPMAAGCLLGRLRDGRTVAVLLTPLLLLDLVHKTRPGTGVYGGILPTLEQYTRNSTLPIVVDDGVFYLQVAYAADANMRSRMTLLTVPDQPPRDPTAQNQTSRTAKFVDYFHVVNLDDFLRTASSLLCPVGNANQGNNNNPAADEGLRTRPLDRRDKRNISVLRRA